MNAGRSPETDEERRAAASVAKQPYSPPKVEAITLSPEAAEALT
jgi:hypothetical protein